MPEYAKKSCNFCGLRDIQPNMMRVSKTSTNTIKNTVTGRDIVGSVLGFKTSQRGLKRGLLSGGGRKSTRTYDVWSCRKCQGYETPQEAAARKARERKLAAEESKRTKLMLVWRAYLHKELKKFTKSSSILKLDKSFEGLAEKDQFNKIKLDAHEVKEFYKNLPRSFKSVEFTLATSNLVKEIPRHELKPYTHTTFITGILGLFLIAAVLYPAVILFTPIYDFLRPEQDSFYTYIGVDGFWDGIGNSLWLWLYCFIAIIIGSVLESFIKNPKKEEQAQELHKELQDINAAYYAEYAKSLNEILEITKIKALDNKDFAAEIGNSDFYGTKVSKSPKISEGKSDTDSLKKLLNDAYLSPEFTSITTYVLMKNIASSDGAVSREEEDMIAKAVKITMEHRGVAESIMSYPNTDKALIKLFNKKTKNSQKAKETLIEILINVAYADLQMTDAEMAVISDYAELLGVTKTKLEKSIQEKKKQTDLIIDEGYDEDINDVFDEFFEDEL